MKLISMKHKMDKTSFLSLFSFSLILILVFGFMGVVYPITFEHNIMDIGIHGNLLLLRSNGGVAGFSTLNNQITWENVNKNRVVGIKYIEDYIYILRDYGSYELLQKINVKTGNIIKGTKFELPGDGKSPLNFEINPMNANNIYIFDDNGLYSCPFIPDDLGNYNYKNKNSKTTQQQCVKIIENTQTTKRVILQYAGPTSWESSLGKTHKIFMYMNGILYVVSPYNKIIDKKTINENINTNGMYLHNDKLIMLTETGVVLYDAELVRYIKKINTIGSPTYIYFDNSNMYVGTSLGYITSVNIETGNVIYKNKATNDGIIKIVKGKIGGNNDIVVGSTNQICALGSDGGVLWSSYLDKPINSFGLISQNLYTSMDKNLNKEDVSDLCSITSHKTGDVLDYEHLTLTGKVSPLASTSLNINGKTHSLDIDQRGNWKYVLDPKTLKIGTNTISCGDPSSGGTKIKIVHPKDFVNGYMYANIPSKMNLGSALNIKVTDAITKKPLDYFYMILDGQRIKVSGNKKTIRLTTKGKHTLIIEKEGYNTFKATIEVKKENGVMSILLDIVGLLVLLIVVYFAYQSFMGKSSIRK